MSGLVGIGLVGNDTYTVQISLKSFAKIFA